MVAELSISLTKFYFKITFKALFKAIRMNVLAVGSSHISIKSHLISARVRGIRADIINQCRKMNYGIENIP